MTRGKPRTHVCGSPGSAWWAQATSGACPLPEAREALTSTGPPESGGVSRARPPPEASVEAEGFPKATLWLVTGGWSLSS